jgi:O-antigen chain-terminating methyltransferase
MTDHFYHAFEEKYRGSRGLIKSRQAAYLPYIDVLKAQRENLKALDLGCGRGEWLELLKEWGIEAEGIDLDASMLSICYEMGLNVREDNALTVLAKMPSSSLDIISGFHIAEHLDFPDLVALVRNAFNALKPGGLLILETPNSENIAVATSSFYLDPTHHNPLPIQLLSFLFEYAGFSAIEEIRLNADIEVNQNSWISLHDVVAGVSRDYGIVGQTPFLTDSGSNLSIKNIQGESGLTYLDLVGRFDSQTHRVNEQIWDAIIESAELKAEITSLQLENSVVLLRLHKLEAPYRLIKRLLRLPFGLIRRLRALVGNLYRALKRIVKKILVMTIKKLGLYQRLHAFYYRNRDRIDYDALNPHAKEVYQDLQDEISKNKRLK